MGEGRERGGREGKWEKGRKVEERREERKKGGKRGRREGDREKKGMGGGEKERRLKREGGE